MPRVQWMRSVKKRPRYAAYVASLAPLLWYSMNEVSGTTVINYGSLGSGNGTFTPGVGAVNQQGQLGAGQAYDFDGADSRIVGPTTTSINNLTVFSYAQLFYADTWGEAGAAYLWSDNGANRLLNLAAAGRFNFGVWCTSAYAQTIMAAGSALSLGNWYWLFGTYDNAGDRLPHQYVGKNGAVTEPSYSTSTAGPGVLSNASGALLVGNNSTSVRTWDGRIDEFLIFNRVLTTNEMTQITLFSRV